MLQASPVLCRQSSNFMYIIFYRYEQKSTSKISYTAIQ